MSSNSTTELDSKAEGFAETKASAQTLMPEMEDRPGGTWSVDEQVFVLADELASLPTQYGVASISGRVNLKFRALDAPDEAISATALHSFLQRVREEENSLIKVCEYPLEIPRQPVRPDAKETDFLE